MLCEASGGLLCQGLGSATLTKEPWEGWVDRESALVWAAPGGGVRGICGDPSSSELCGEEGRLHNSLCAQSDLQAFSRIVTPGGKKKNLMNNGGGERRRKRD